MRSSIGPPAAGWEGEVAILVGRFRYDAAAASAILQGETRSTLLH
jgi:hypothetical protein